MKILTSIFVVICCVVAIIYNSEHKAQKLYDTAVGIKTEQGCAKAIDVYKQVMDKYPHSSSASLARKELASCDKKMQELFSGYQNIRFGSKTEKVKELFAGKLTSSGDISGNETYLQYSKDKAKILFLFFNDSLYRVKVNPNDTKKRIAHGLAKQDLLNTINALTLKYGKYNKIPNMAMGFGGLFAQKVECYRWSYNSKEITLTYWDMGDDWATAWQTLDIEYKDLILASQKDGNDSMQEQKRLKESAQSKKQELEGVI